MRKDSFLNKMQPLRKLLNTSARLLRLVSLLSARPSWTCGELAGRMAVTERTVRRDIARLRELGYGVESDLVLYPREPHGLREEKHLVDRLTRILAWYDKHLGPGTRSDSSPR